MSNKKTPGYKTWVGIRQRCYNVNEPAYPNYGGRGIKVCERWKNSFEAFLEDMGPRPSKSHTLDRIDNSGPYCKENCRWVFWKEQARNKRNNVKMTVEGVTKLLVEWCDEYKVSHSLVRGRVRLGWDPFKALTTPNMHR